MTHRRAAWLAVIALSLGSASCADRSYEITDLSNEFVVTPNFYGIDEGFPPIQYEATIGGDPVPVTWESSNPAVASVTPTGLVSPLTDGFAAITATLTSNPTRKRSASLTVNALLGTPLTSGVAVTGIDGDVGDTDLLYRIFVPAGSTQLQVLLSGGTGDFDIYLRRSTPPGTAVGEFTCRSWNAGNTENCTINNPQSGTWYIYIDVYDAGAGVSLTATVTP